MGKSNKLFKALVIGVKAFKSPSKDKSEKGKFASEGDKDRVKASKDKCLWSLGKSSSRERNSVAAAVAYLDAPNISYLQNEDKHVKDGSHTSHSFTSTPAYSPESLVKAEAASFSGCEPADLVEREELAAVKIQAAYRSYRVSLQVFRSLRAVVRLQALARGQMVRKQASATLQCMQAIVRLQALARGRRIRSSELGQFVQRHLQQTSQQRKKLVEGWISSISSLQQSQAKAQSKQDAAMKQQCALMVTYSALPTTCTPTHCSLVANDFQPDKNHWGWVWLERWMVARPWENLSGIPKEHNKEIVQVKAGVEVNEESLEECISPLKNSVGNANIESSSFMEPESECSSNFQPAMEKEALPSLETMKVEHVHIPADVEKVKRGEKFATKFPSTDNDAEIKKTAPLSAPPVVEKVKEGEKSATEFASTYNNSEIKKTASLSTPPPPPPPPPPLYAKRANPVAHVTTSPKGQQAAILANSCFEMPVAFKVPDLTLASRAAELPVETCSTTLATQLNSPCGREPSSIDLPSSPVKDSLPFTSTNKPTVAITSQTTLQSDYDLPLLHNESSQITSSLTQEVDEVLPGSDTGNFSMPVPTASDIGPISSSQTSSLPTVFSEELVLSPEKRAPACSPSYVTDVIHHYEISNQGYTSEDTGCVIAGERNTLAVPLIFGISEGNVTTNPAASGSMDVENDPVDMHTEVPESIDFKMEVIQGESLSKATGGHDASGAPAGEKGTDVSSGKHLNPVSKQGQHTEAVSPSVPNYMTKTKCSQAKIRTLTSLEQSLDSAKQKGDSRKPRFDSSARQKGNSPKQKLDSSKQEFDSPIQKADPTIKRRHSLSAMEGKGSRGAPKASPHVRAGRKGQVSALKDTCSETLPFSNGGSRRHGKLVAV